MLIDSDSNQDREHYDRLYRVPRAFKERPWLYRPLIRRLIRTVKRPSGKVIDAGCGQGQFTALLTAAGLPVVGVDISPQAIASAESQYPKCHFQTGDIRALPAGSCSMIFARSLSSYNSPSFATDRSITDSLMHALESGGALVWLYNIMPGYRQPGGWRHHTLSDVRAHFKAYPDTRIAFSLRIDGWLPRRIFWSRAWSAIAYTAARLLHLGGELVVIVTDSGVPPLL